MKRSIIIITILLIVSLCFAVITINCSNIKPAQKVYSSERARKKIEKVCKDFINFDITAEECKTALEEIDLTHSIERAKDGEKEKLKDLHYTKLYLIGELENPDNCRGIMSGFWLAYYEEILKF